jgi:predicted small integral membrane protein
MDGVDVADGAFFIVIALCAFGMAVWEWRAPGGAPRRGVSHIVQRAATSCSSQLLYRPPTST